MHDIAQPVPFVEIAYDTDSLRVRSPNGEARAAHAIDGDDMRTELLINVVMITFAKEVKVEIGKVGRRHVVDC